MMQSSKFRSARPVETINDACCACIECSGEGLSIDPTVPPAEGDSPARPGSWPGVRLRCQRGCRNVSNKCSQCGSLILFQRKMGRRGMEILYRTLSRERNTAIWKAFNDQHPRISCSMTAPFKRIYTIHFLHVNIQPATLKLRTSKQKVFWLMSSCLFKLK